MALSEIKYFGCLRYLKPISNFNFFSFDYICNLHPAYLKYIFLLQILHTDYLIDMAWLVGLNIVQALVARNIFKVIILLKLHRWCSA